MSPKAAKGGTSELSSLPTARDIGRWYQEAQQRSAAEFAARHPELFFVVGQLNSDPDKVDFRTCDSKSRFALLAEAARLEQDALGVIPIDKSPRNPYSDRISLGRARNCDVVIRHPSISKLHAHVRVHEDGSYTLVDLDSRNGTRIGERVLTPHMPEPLLPNSVVILGEVVLRVMNAERLREELLRSSGQSID